jgi:hypothetical protein
VARRIRQRGRDVLRRRVRAVLALTLLVLHDAALLVELGLVEHREQVAHAVALEPQRAVEGARRHGLEVVRAVVVRRAVDARRAELGDELEPVGVRVLAAVEHQVLEEVREPRAPRPLVLRADVVPDVHADDRRLVVLVDDDGEAVGEDLLRERDVRHGEAGCCAGRRIRGARGRGRQQRGG